MDTAAPRADSALLLDAIAFTAGVLLACAGTFGVLWIGFDFARATLRHSRHAAFIAVFIAWFLVPWTLLLLSLGWFLARRGVHRLVTPERSLHVQAVLVRGLGALLLLSVLFLLVSWSWLPALVILTGLFCMLGAYGQMLRPPRIGPFLFGTSIVLSATVAWRFAWQGFSREVIVTTFPLLVACAVSLPLTAPWRRLLRRG